MVTHKRWQRIEEILVSSWEVEPERREQFLKDSCGDDSDLLRDVLKLRAADALIEQWPLPATPTADKARQRLGPYEVDRLIGRGGMGAVYLAHRADGAFEQQAAVKVIGLPFEIEEMRARFRRERQILAALKHPNITRLLDGGVTDDGQLYLVMEYVDGVPITKFPASVDAKFELFRGVCAAVQYAHQNLIVHRDIKPSNILVDREGNPKLLDFGAAKLLADPEATQTGFAMATVAYASPEQLRGEAASTLSDVFSLGAVLYELMAGEKPFGDNLTLRLRDGESGSLNLLRPLPGDLNTIVRKALAVTPEERYQSVEQLAEDVRRYRNGEPVVAHPPSFSYRARRFLKRRWLPVTAAVAFVAGLAAATTISIQQARVARSETLNAQNETTRQRKLTNFLEEMLASGTNGGDIQVSRMLEEVEPVLEKTFKGDPVTEASLRMNIGASFVTMRKPEQAAYQLKKAMALFHSAGSVKGEVVVLWIMGQGAGARGNYREAVSDYEQALERVNRPDTKAAPIWVFRVNRDLGKLLFTANHGSLHDLERERRFLEEALAVAQRNAPTSTALSAQDLLDAHRALAEILVVEGKYREVEEQLAQMKLLSPHGERSSEAREILDVRISMALEKRDFAAARNYERQVIEGAGRTVARNLALARFTAESGGAVEALKEVRVGLPAILAERRGEELIGPLSDVSHVMICANQFRDAERYARQELKILDEAQREEMDPDRAQGLELLGAALAGERRYRESLALLEQSEHMFRASAPGFAVEADYVAGLRKETLKRAGHQP